MYALHSLQRHDSGFHDLINFLILLKELLYLILFGISSRILGLDILLTVSHSERFLCFISEIDYKMNFKLYEGFYN